MRSIACLLLLAVPGCYASHLRPSDAPEDVAESSVPDAAVLPPPSETGCSVATAARFVGDGSRDVRFPSFAPGPGGFFGTYVRGSHEGEYPSRAGWLDASHERLASETDVGIVTSPVADVASSLEAGGDGRFAACAIQHYVDGPPIDVAPGGVVFLRADGSLERRVALDWECVDVAFVAGRWVTVEVREETHDVEGTARERVLVVFDEALSPIRRIHLGWGEISLYDERVVAAGDRAVVAIREPGYPRRTLALRAVDVDAGAVVAETRVPLEIADLSGSQRIALAARDETTFLAFSDVGGDLLWASFDRELDLVHPPSRIADADEHVGALDLALLPSGMVVAWNEGISPWFEPLAVALVDERDGAVTRVAEVLPEPAASLRGDWVDLTVVADYALVAAQVSDSEHGELWTWGARCAVR